VVVRVEGKKAHPVKLQQCANRRRRTDSVDAGDLFQFELVERTNRHRKQHRISHDRGLLFMGERLEFGA
jgi:hypothetical protein